MEAKITKKMKFEGMIAYFKGEDTDLTETQFIEFCEEQIADLDKKAAKAKERDGPHCGEASARTPRIPAEGRCVPHRRPAAQRRQGEARDPEERLTFRSRDEPLQTAVLHWRRGGVRRIRRLPLLPQRQLHGRRCAQASVRRGL